MLTGSRRLHSVCRSVILRQQQNKLQQSHRSKTTRATVVEVGPRDGLQNEKKIVPTAQKVELIDRLSDTGLSIVESTSFVSPKWVPQMADNAEVVSKIAISAQKRFPALVPNVKGLEAAIGAGVRDIAIFAAASESFSKKNINCSIEESVRRFDDVCRLAKEEKMTIRGYVSCVVGCPYEGPIEPDAVLKVSEQLLSMGCYEISLGDTIGVGTPGSFNRLFDVFATAGVPWSKLAVHCHDTYGQALSNVHAALLRGITVFDSSVSGLGGCPYAKGASGNVATEDLVYMLHGMGYSTGVDLNKLIDVSVWISELLNRQPLSKVTLAKMAAAKNDF